MALERERDPQSHSVTGDINASRPRPESQIGISHRMNRTEAAMSAHCIVTESLMHALCFELPQLSRARILNVLDLVYSELEAALGDDAEVVRAFGEQRDSLRDLLVTSLNEAKLALGR